MLLPNIAGRVRYGSAIAAACPPGATRTGRSARAWAEELAWPRVVRDLEALYAKVVAY